MLIDSERLQSIIDNARKESYEYLKANPLANIDVEYARRGTLEWMLKVITSLENEALSTKCHSTTTSKNLLLALRGELREMILLINKNIDESEDAPE